MIWTEAIVLGISPYSESSLIVRLLTAEAGVVRVLAKGARRPKNRFQGALEPLARVAAMVGVRDPEQLGNLGETTPIAHWTRLRSDVERLAYAGLGIETLGRLAGASAPDRFFYDEACRFLEALERARGAGSLTIALLVRLLHQGGFPPRIDAALLCGAMPPTVVYDFEAARFEAPSATASPHAMRLPGTAVAAMAGALANPPALDGGFEVAKGAGPVLLRWLIRVWEDHLGARLKAAEFLEKMVLNAQ
jgi:DNA repair protein RecO (recombination protein O)